MAAPIAAPFQPPATAPIPAPTPAPPAAPTAVRAPGVAHAARTATRETEVRNFRMVTSFTMVRWLASTASSTTGHGARISAVDTGERLLAPLDEEAVLSIPVGASVPALRGRIRQVRGPQAHAEPARQPEDESEAHRGGAVGGKKPRWRIGEPFGAPESVERDVVEVVDPRRDRHVHVLQLALLVDGELDHRAPILPQVDGPGRIAPGSLVLHLRGPDPPHRLLHAVDEPRIAEAAAVQQRLVAFLEAAQIVDHRSAGDRAERLARAIQREGERALPSRRPGLQARHPFRTLLP